MRFAKNIQPGQGKVILDFAAALTGTSEVEGVRLVAASIWVAAATQMSRGAHLLRITFPAVVPVGPGRAEDTRGGSIPTDRRCWRFTGDPLRAQLLAFGSARVPFLRSYTVGVRACVRVHV